MSTSYGEMYHRRDSGCLNQDSGQGYGHCGASPAGCAVRAIAVRCVGSRCSRAPGSIESQMNDALSRAWSMLMLRFHTWLGCGSGCSRVASRESRASGVSVSCEWLFVRN